MKGKIKITELDYERLCNLVTAVKDQRTVEMKNLDALGAEIRRAERVDPKKITPEFVTMNSEFEVTDLDSNKLLILKLVYPKDADFKKGYVSVLSPLGSALLGYKAGDTISFKVPKGEKKIRIDKINYQPEANGEYAL